MASLAGFLRHGCAPSWGGGLISFFLNGLFLEGKSMLLLKFCCCLGVYSKLCLRTKVNLAFHKYVDGGQIMDGRVG
jgi:hypothetical protein